MALFVDEPQPILLIVLDAATFTAIAHASRTLLKSLTDYIEEHCRERRVRMVKTRSDITGDDRCGLLYLSFARRGFIHGKGIRKVISFQEHRSLSPDCWTPPKA